MKRRSQKLLWLVLAAVIAMLAAAFGASAAGSPDVVNMTYDGTQTAEQALSAAVEAVKDSDVTLTLKADMVFTEELDIGTFNEISEHTLTITGDGGRLVYKIPAEYAEVVIHANTVIKDVTIHNSGKTEDGTGCNDWQKGNAIAVLNAKSRYENVTVTKDNGVNPVIIGNDLTVVNSSTFGTIMGNRYKSGYDVENSTITLAGNTTTQAFYGSSFNGNEANTGMVTGDVTVLIQDDACVMNDFYGAGWYTRQNRKTTVSIDTTRNMSNIYAGASTANGILPETTLTINNANVTGAVYATRFAGDSTANNGQILNSKIIINGGTFSNMVFGGANSNGKNAIVKGTASLEINGGSFTNADKYIYGGSFLINGTANVKSTLTITSGTFANMIFGGSYIENAQIHGNTETTVKNISTAKAIYGGSNINHINAVDSGNYTMTITDCSFTATGATPIGGANISAGVFSGNSVLNFGTGNTFNAAYATGGSKINNTNSTVTGNSKLSVDIGEEATLAKTVYGGHIFVGVGNSSGNTLLELKSGILTQTVYGGCYYNQYSTKTYDGEWGHKGGSGVVIEEGASLSGNVYGGSYVYPTNYIGKSGMTLNDIPVAGAEGTLTYVTFNGGSVTGNIIGGSYVRTEYLAIAEQRGDTKVTINAPANLTNGTIYAGTYNAQLVGDSYLELNADVTHTGAFLAGGCGGTKLIEGNEHGAYDFTHKGNVYVTTTEGVYKSSNVSGTAMYVTGQGNGSLQKGNVYFDIKGGTFSRISAFHQKMTQNESGYVEGDIEARISGGTFNSTVHWGAVSGATSGNYTPKNGNLNYVNGNSTLIISGGTFNAGIAGSGLSGCTGNTLVKFIGDKFNFNGTWLFSAGNGTSYQPAGNMDDSRATIDFSQVTLSNADFQTQFGGTKNIGNTSIRGFGTCIPPMNECTSVSAVGELDKKNYTRGEKVDLSGLVFTYQTGITVKYNRTINGSYKTTTVNTGAVAGEDLNNSSIVALTAGNGATLTDNKVGYATTSVKMSVNSFEIDREFAITVAGPSAAPEYVGSSIRLADPRGLRIKASIDSAILAEADGFNVTRVGILVSKSKANALVRGGQYVADGCVYGEGVEGFIINEEKDGRYVFALSITGIDAIDFDTALAFRPYVEYTDEYGETGVVYTTFADEVAGIENNNLVRTIQTVAAQVAADEEFMASIPADQKKYIEDILASAA